MAAPPNKRLRLRSTSGEGPENEATENEPVDREIAESKRKPKQVSILLLNDYCLYEVIKQMPLNDLCALSQTCQRIHALCTYFFQRGFKEKILIIDSIHEDGRLVKHPSNESYVNIFEKNIQNVVFGRNCASKNALQRLNLFYKPHQTIEGEGVQEVVQNAAVMERSSVWKAGPRVCVNLMVL